jgi:hypothetical protein
VAGCNGTRGSAKSTQVGNRLGFGREKFFRYLSASKVNRLARGDEFAAGGSPSILGIGGGIIRSPKSLIERLESVLDDLQHKKLLGSLDSRGCNFIFGQGRFVEYAMKQVVIWIAHSGSTILLIGGSTRFLNFDNFGKTEMPGVVPGTNRTAILNALTTLWRTAFPVNAANRQAGPRDIEFYDTLYGVIDGSQVRTTSHDEIPYAVESLIPRSLRAYMREARATYELCPDCLVDNLEYAAVVYTDHMFSKGEARAVRACERPIMAGDRLVIASPLYVAQLRPSA